MLLRSVVVAQYQLQIQHRTAHKAQAQAMTLRLAEVVFLGGCQGFIKRLKQVFQYLT